MPGSYVMGSRYALVGDPGIFSVLGKVAKLGAGLIPGVGGLVSRALGGIGQGGVRKILPAQIAKLTTPMLAPPIVQSIPRQLLIGAGSTAAASAGLSVVGSAVRGVATRTNVGRLAAAGAGVAGAAGVASMFMPGARRRFRHMNVLNPKALKRATRRLSGFHHFAVSTESELRKLAPRSTRACKPRAKPCR